MADMASSRIFVKGLPPTFSDEDFRKHFSQKHEITDAKIFPNRRIGYIGYKTPEDAQRAVKYFNRTFIRMSRIGVELARPIQDAKTFQQQGSAANGLPMALKAAGTSDEASGVKRKRASEGQQEADPKLKEFLESYKPKSKRKAWDSMDGAGSGANQVTVVPNVDKKDASDGEYETVPKKAKKTVPMSEQEPAAAPNLDTGKKENQAPLLDRSEQSHATVEINEAEAKPSVSDSDWARSRTSRLLGLLDDEEEKEPLSSAAPHPSSPDRSKIELTSTGAQRPALTEAAASIPTPPADENIEAPDNETDTDPTGVRSTMRLFLRNLSYDVTQAALEAEFAPFGALEEIHVPMDVKTGAPKGFAYLQFTDANAAEKAFTEKDGQFFQGRLLHILPASAKRESKLDDFALSKLPLKKQQQIKRKREASSTTFNWNALYMNADAVVSSVADRLGLAKSEILDPTSSDAAVKQAHAETHIIQETKAYFKTQGVDLDAFKRSQRGDTAILVKNIPYDCSKDELKRLFEEHGDIKRFLMPPSGTLAVVEFANAAQCQLAFGSLAYKKVKSSILFLEKAPKDLFTGQVANGDTTITDNGLTRTSASDLKDSDQVVPDSAGTATLFIRNLNFSTTTPILTETFKPLDGFMSARVKTRTDAKKPGQVLSMGFGFLEFRSSQQARAALQAMDGYTLEGHKLQIRASHKGADAAEERRKADTAKKVAGKKTKIVIKNLPFEATKKDVRALFSAYGQLRSVRVPKKMDRGARGFAFADFTTPKEAESAIDALKDTHLLGRRLVIDFAAGDAEDAEAEIERMQQKVGAQVNKVALQKLTSGGRKKFSTGNEEDDV